MINWRNAVKKEKAPKNYSKWKFWQNKNEFIIKKKCINIKNTIFKTEMHNIFRGKINKIALSSTYKKIIEFNRFSRKICIYNKHKIKRKTEKN